MAEWRALAEAQLSTLMRVATGDTAALLHLLDIADARLVRWIAIFRRACQGFETRPGDIPDHPYPRASPIAAIERARRELVLLAEDHARAGDVFALCARRLGLVLPADDPLWPLWEAHRADALRHADRARQSLRSAAAHARAAVHARDMLVLYPLRSGGWFEWSRASLEIVDHAFMDVDVAAAAARGMSRAVAWEFLFVYKIMNRRDRVPRCLIQALHAYPFAPRR